MKDKEVKLNCWNLFLSILKMSAFTVGGGYVMIPMMKERFAQNLGWISEDELAEFTALGQSAPGAMFINCAVLMGYKLLGFKGAVSAALGAALPPLFILSLVCTFYEIIRDNVYVSAAFRGMRAGVAAVIADAVITMAQPYFNREKIVSVVIMAAAFLTAFFFDINVAIIIVSCGVLGVIIGFIKRRGEKRI